MNNCGSQSLSMVAPFMEILGYNPNAQPNDDRQKIENGMQQ